MSVMLNILSSWTCCLHSFLIYKHTRPQHTNFSHQKGANFQITPMGFMKSVNPKFASFHGKKKVYQNQKCFHLLPLGQHWGSRCANHLFTNLESIVLFRKVKKSLFLQKCRFMKPFVVMYSDCSFITLYLPRKMSIFSKPNLVCGYCTKCYLF